jgi:hypothetical protein
LIQDSYPDQKAWQSFQRIWFYKIISYTSRKDIGWRQAGQKKHKNKQEQYPGIEWPLL